MPQYNPPPDENPPRPDRAERTRRLSKPALHRAPEEDPDRTIMDRTLQGRSELDKTIVAPARRRHKAEHRPVENAHGAKRRHRRRWDWNKAVRRFCALALIAEAGWALFFNPYLRVTKVEVVGAQTLTPEHVFAEARVPNGRNIFRLALTEPLVRRLQADPVVDHAARRIKLPDTLVLRVWERRPFATLVAGGDDWLLDAHGIPYRALDAPAPGLPIIQLQGDSVNGVPVSPDTVALGRPLPGGWLRQTYALIALLARRGGLDMAKITVDQNANICLNRKDNVQILLGQPDALPQKVALAQAAVTAKTADGEELVSRAAYIDVSVPEQPVWKPRDDAGDREGAPGDNGGAGDSR